MSWHIHDDMSFADSDAYGIDTDLPDDDWEEDDPWDAPYDEDEAALERDYARRNE